MENNLEKQKNKKWTIENVVFLSYMMASILSIIGIFISISVNDNILFFKSLSMMIILIWARVSGFFKFKK